MAAPRDFAAPRDAVTTDVRAALAEPGCPVCRLAHRAVGKFISSSAYEYVNDLELRAHLRGARGFCNVHAHRWLRESHDVLGTALIYADVIKNALRAFDGAPRRSTGRGWLAALTPGAKSEPATCPGCLTERDAERRYLTSLLDALADPAVVAAFAASDGVCLPHAQLAAQLGGPTAPILVERARSEGEALVRQLDEVIRKEDYRFRHEERTPEERTAPARAIRWAAGEEGITHLG